MNRRTLFSVIGGLFAGAALPKVASAGRVSDAEFLAALDRAAKTKEPLLCDCHQCNEGIDRFYRMVPSLLKEKPSKRWKAKVEASIRGIHAKKDCPFCVTCGTRYKVAGKQHCTIHYGQKKIVG